MNAIGISIKSRTSDSVIDYCYEAHDVETVVAILQGTLAGIKDSDFEIYSVVAQ